MIILINSLHFVEKNKISKIFCYGIYDIFLNKLTRKIILFRQCRVILNLICLSGANVIFKFLIFRVVTSITHLCNFSLQYPLMFQNQHFINKLTHRIILFQHYYLMLYLICLSDAKITIQMVILKLLIFKVVISITRFCDFSLQYLLVFQNGHFKNELTHRIIFLFFYFLYFPTLLPYFIRNIALRCKKITIQVFLF